MNVVQSVDVFDTVKKLVKDHESSFERELFAAEN